MSDSFEALLDAHLERLRNGQSIGEPTEAPVDDAAHLSAMVETAAMIRDLPRPSLSPRAARLIEKRLIDRAAAMRGESHNHRTGAHGLAALPLMLFRQARPFHRTIGLAASVLLVFAVMGVGSVLAAGDSLPASPLYGLKIAGERAQLMMSNSAAGRARARLLMAEHRLAELEAIVAAGQAQPDDLIEGLQQEIDSALTEIETLAPSNAVGLLSQLEKIIARQQGILQSVLLIAPTASKDDLSKAAAAADHTQTHVSEALARSLRDETPSDNAGSRQSPTTTPTPEDTTIANPFGASSPRAVSAPVLTAASPTSTMTDDAGNRGSGVAKEEDDEEELETPRGESSRGEPAKPSIGVTNTPAAAPGVEKDEDDHKQDEEDERQGALQTPAPTATPSRIATSTAGPSGDPTNTPQPSPSAARTNTPKSTATVVRTSTPSSRDGQRAVTSTPAPTHRDD